jgi:hypothetical protein
MAMGWNSRREENSPLFERPGLILLYALLERGKNQYYVPGISQTTDAAESGFKAGLALLNLQIRFY